MESFLCVFTGLWAHLFLFVKLITTHQYWEKHSLPRFQIHVV